MAYNLESIKECGICQEEYNEETRCPRILPCFHCICAECIGQLIQKTSKICPFCRREFQAQSATDIPINYMAVDLIKYVSQLEITSKGVKGNQDNAQQKRFVEIMQDSKEMSNSNLNVIEESEERVEEIIKELNNLEGEMIQENTRIEKEVLPRMHDIMVTNNENVLVLNIFKEQLHNKLKDMRSQKVQLKTVKEKLETCKEESFQKAGSLLDDAEVVNSKFLKGMKDFEEFLSEEKRNLQRTQKEFTKREGKINIIIDVINSQNEREDEDIMPMQTMAAVAIQDRVFLPQMTIETLQCMTDPVKQLIKRGKIFASKGGRFAQISLTEDSKLCLHHLKEKRPPSNSHVLQHDDLMALVDPPTRLTFLDFGMTPNDGSSSSSVTFGRIYIALHLVSEKAFHFSLLCTGERGPSYANTNMIRVWNKGQNGEGVVGGDYEQRYGDGGKALVPGVGTEWWLDEFESTCLAGTVAGWWYGGGDARAAQFIIITKDDPQGMMLRGCFGRLHGERSLVLLRYIVSRNPRIEEVGIQDCGIVIPI